MLDLFIWLAYRFPDAFVGAEEVAQMRSVLSGLIDSSIRSMGVQRWVWDREGSWLCCFACDNRLALQFHGCRQTGCR